MRCAIRAATFWAHSAATGATMAREAKVIHQISYVSWESYLPRVLCNSFTEQTGGWIARIQTCQRPNSCMVSLGTDCDWRNECSLPPITSFYGSFVKGRDLFIASHYQCNYRERRCCQYLVKMRRLRCCIQLNVSPLSLEQPFKVLKWAWYCFTT